MSIKRKIAALGVLMLISGALLIGLLAAVYIYLPSYLESRVVPQIASDAGIRDYAMDVRHVGFFGADLGTARLGPPEDPALVIRSIQIDYSPLGLYRREIKQITLGGIEIRGEFKERRLTLRGAVLERLLTGADSRPESKSPPDDPGSGVSISKVSVRNSQAEIKISDRHYRIPFELDVTPGDDRYNILEIAARIYPRGETIGLKLNLNRLQHQAALRMDSTILDLGRFADITTRITGLSITGLLESTIKAKLGWNPLQIMAVDASVALKGANIFGRGIQLQTAPDSADGATPFRIRLSEQQPGVWRVEGGSLSMAAPVPLNLSQFDGTIQMTDLTLAAAVDFNVAVRSTASSGAYRLPLVIRNPILLRSRISAEYGQNGQWSCSLSDIPTSHANPEPIQLELSRYIVTAAPPGFNVSARSAADQIEADYQLSLQPLMIRDDTESIVIPGLTLRGDARFGRHALGARFNLSAPKIGIDIKAGKFNTPKFSVSGRLNRGADRQITSTGLLEFSGVNGRLSQFPARFTGARGKIPFQWPPAKTTAKGSIDIAKLIFENMEFGNLHSEIRQTKNGIEFKGRHQSQLLPRLASRFSGTSILFGKTPPETRVRVELSRSGAAPEIDLGRFMPEARGLRVKGDFQLTGDLVQGPKGFSGSIRTDFNDGNLRWKRSKLSIDGIRLALSIPELPRLRSSPGQQIHFDRISWGNFIAQNGRIDFQIESGKSLLLEKIRFRWCDGKVETQSMRITPKADDFYMTFYCDRLNLAKVLEQFGAAAAEGKGTVNGRIPLQIAGGNIRFDDGFLFSTPGEGGKIRLSGTDILTAGIPPDTAQFVQMELAKEALKDYDYSWAKLNLTSQGEELLLQMQMDGKPAKTLPFVYRKDIGGFTKVEANAKGSKFQGIRLDVNFRLPLNKLLQYKELIEMIQ